MYAGNHGFHTGPPSTSTHPQAGAQHTGGMQQRMAWQSGIVSVPAITLHGLAESVADMKNSMDQLRREMREQFAALRQTLDARLSENRYCGPCNLIGELEKQVNDTERLVRARMRENARLRVQVQAAELSLPEGTDPYLQASRADSSSEAILRPGPDAEGIVLESIAVILAD